MFNSRQTSLLPRPHHHWWCPSEGETNLWHCLCLLGSLKKGGTSEPLWLSLPQVQYPREYGMTLVLRILAAIFRLARLRPYSVCGRSYSSGISQLAWVVPVGEQLPWLCKIKLMKCTWFWPSLAVDRPLVPSAIHIMTLLERKMFLKTHLQFFQLYFFFSVCWTQMKKKLSFFFLNWMLF